MSEIFSMTNSSKLIELDGCKYILRLPGKGTDKLINRKQEKEVYDAIKDYKISDEVLMFDTTTGVKIARFIEGTHNCKSDNDEDVKRSMKAVKHLHDLKLSVNHKFDLAERILFYEKLMKKSKYEDYEEVKSNVLILLNTIHNVDNCLCHIDPNQDNCLVHDNENKVTLVDWEYAAMQDPILDVAMFAIYAGYEKSRVDWLLSVYKPTYTYDEKVRYYIYIAASGLLWSNWCEFKNNLGQTFGGTYELSQFNYARQYSKYAKELM